MTLMMQNLNRLMLNITINDQNLVGKGDEPELSDVWALSVHATTVTTLTSFSGVDDQVNEKPTLFHMS